MAGATSNSCAALGSLRLVKPSIPTHADVASVGGGDMTAGVPTDSELPAGPLDAVRQKSRAIGDLALTPAASAGAPVPQGPAGPDPDEPADVLIELNMFYPGGLREVTRDFEDLWGRFVAQQGPPQPDTPVSLLQRAPVPISRKLYQCVLTRRMLASLLALDHSGPEAPASIFRAWPDYPLYTHIDRSAATVKVDAALKSFSATGKNVVWAILDTGIDADHPHFSGLELSREKANDPAPRPATGGCTRTSPPWSNRASATLSHRSPH